MEGPCECDIELQGCISHGVAIFNYRCKIYNLEFRKKGCKKENYSGNRLGSAPTPVLDNG